MDKYITGLQLMILGMGTVLLTLYLLSLFINISSRFFGPEEQENNKYEENNTENYVTEGIDRKKIAAVSSVIYQLLDRREYKIISIKKKNSAWKN